MSWSRPLGRLHVEGGAKPDGEAERVVLAGYASNRVLHNLNKIGELRVGEGASGSSPVRISKFWMPAVPFAGSVSGVPVGVGVTWIAQATAVSFQPAGMASVKW